MNLRRRRTKQPSSANAVHKYHSHSIPLNMKDIRDDWEKPITEAGIAAKASVIVRVGMLDLGAGTGSFRVREMMHRIAYPLGVHVRADVNLTDIEASCTDGEERIAEVVNLPTTGVNTERIWLLEHYADWFSVNLGKGAMYHARAEVSDELMEHLDERDESQVSANFAKQLRQEDSENEPVGFETGQWLDAMDAVEERCGEHPVTLPQLSQDSALEMRSANESQAVQEVQAAQSTQAVEGVQPTQATTSVTDEATEVAQRTAQEGVQEQGVASQSVPAAKSAPRKLRQRAYRTTPEAQYAAHFDHVEKLQQQQQARAEKRAQQRVEREQLEETEQQDHGITVREAHERLDMIEHRSPLYSPLFAGFAAAVACASFVFLLGGAPYDMLGAFCGAGVGQFVRRKMLGRWLNQFFVTFVAVAIAAFVCVGVLRGIALFDVHALQHDTAYIGAVLFVIPGFPMITGGMDMAKIDFPSGVQRIAYVLCIILMATLAGWMVAAIVRLNPSGFVALNIPWWATMLLRMVFAFLGVWGFSVLFNSPQRMCVVAGCIGAITDTLRLELVDAGTPVIAAAFIGALLAGLLASAWRSSVRHGLLPLHLGYPRICLTVPSIVIMVPGMYMYQAMFNLGQMNTMNALDWAFRAFMVIMCLPIGLIMARVLTDKAWRYDD